jgi:hypothetical protein
MALRFAPEPQNGSALVQAGLNRILRRPEAPAAMQAMTLTTTQVTAPHAVYDLDADKVAAGGGLETARATGFRYLVNTAGNSVAAAEVQVDASGAAQVLANVNFGPFVAATSQALAYLSTLSQVASRSYEARLLRFAAIGVMAIWLKADEADADIVYPLAPVPDMLQPGKTYAPADFFAAVMLLAKKRAANRGPAVP